MMASSCFVSEREVFWKRCDDDGRGKATGMSGMD